MSEQDAVDTIIIPQFKLPTVKRHRACAACEFGVKEQADLTCHRMPPQSTFLGLPQQMPSTLGRPGGGGIAIQNFTGFPIIRPDQWCGEFRPRGGDA